MQIRDRETGSRGSSLLADTLWHSTLLIVMLLLASRIVQRIMTISV